MKLFDLYKYISSIEMFLFMIFCFMVNSHETYMYIGLALTIINFAVMCLICAWRDMNQVTESLDNINTYE